MGRQPNMAKHKEKALEKARRVYRKAMKPHWQTYQETIDQINQEYGGAQ